MTSKASVSCDAMVFKTLLEHQARLEHYIATWTAQQRHLLTAAGKSPTEASNMTTATTTMFDSLEPPVSLAPGEYWTGAMDVVP